MPKKSRREKQLAALHREIEALRSQLRTRPGENHGITSEVEDDLLREAPIGAPSNSDRVTAAPFVFDRKYLIADLRRTALLSAVIILAIAGIFLTHTHWESLL